MATTTSSPFSLPLLRTTHSPVLLPCPNFIQHKLTFKFPRLAISYPKRKVFPVVVSCLVGDNSKAYNEAEGSSGFITSTPMQCGERSQKLINRLAYEKGTVFVQCTGCSQYHKLVDNLNLVVEYDLREDESNTTPDTDEV